MVRNLRTMPLGHRPVRESPSMSRSVTWSLSLVAAVVLLVAGCGGGASTYTVAKTTACLEKRGDVELRKKVDFVASTALGGAIGVVFEQNEVTISFALDDEEAARLDAAYRKFKGQNIGIDDVLRPKNNAVLLWEAHPSDDQIDAVDRCLN